MQRREAATGTRAKIRPECEETHVDERGRRAAGGPPGRGVRHQHRPGAALHLLAARCRAAAQASGWRPLLAETTRDDRGFRLAQGAVRSGARLLFAAGGDGTVAACAQALARTGVPLAIIPLGTANLAARALGIPKRLDAALAVGFGGHQRRIDLAAADGLTFAAMAGIGLDAAVAAGTPAAVKERLGWAAYALSGAARLPGRPATFTVRLDAGEPLTRVARCVVVGNAGVLPGGFVLLPRARLDDGLLDVGILARPAPTGGRVSLTGCWPAGTVTVGNVGNVGSVGTAMMACWSGTRHGGCRSAPPRSCPARLTASSSLLAGRSPSPSARERCSSGPPSVAGRDQSSRAALIRPRSSSSVTSAASAGRRWMVPLLVLRPGWRAVNSVSRPCPQP